jgi:hypothetical protein
VLSHFSPSYPASLLRGVAATKDYPDPSLYPMRLASAERQSPLCLGKLETWFFMRKSLTRKKESRIER